MLIVAKTALLQSSLTKSIPLLIAMLLWAIIGCADIQRLIQQPTHTPTQPPVETVPASADRFRSEPIAPLTLVVPFSNVAETALNGDYQLWNDRPGVAVFDYDRDGDLDFYVTSRGGESNRLYRNAGDATFTDVAAQAGVQATDSHSTGVVACDINNDGYQDLYVGAWGNPDDGLGFRSPQKGNIDSLFLNDGSGGFIDITAPAFGDAINVRSAISISCADVNNDGWLDIYVGNLMDDDYRAFADYNHPGHYNLLYLNNGNLRFTEIAQDAGVAGPQIRMTNPDGSPVIHEHPVTGKKYEGYNAASVDDLGNRVGEPTGQTHAVAFFDYDDDGDPDLWVANDGDRMHLFRNDTTQDGVRFTPVARELGIDVAGSWMGFAIGDYDADADLDIFSTNIGFHPLLQEPVERPRGNCEYVGRFRWGTCGHFLLRNEGSGQFIDVAPTTRVAPSPWLPPASLDSSIFNPAHHVPTGLAAYDFGFGATFLDYDNDGYQDLYWFGSTLGRGEGPGGQVFPAAGRMLRSLGNGAFEDITVRAHLLDISRVNYEGLDEDEAARSDPILLKIRRIDTALHENGKGVAHGDLNGDGFPDLIATNSSGPIFAGPFDSTTGEAPTRAAPGPMFVWLNGGGVSNWLTLRLKGRMAIDSTGSNADAVGARVYLTTRPSGSAQPHIQVQEVIAGSSYLSMDSLDLEFGLGRATTIEKIEIHWPSGTTQTLQDIPANQVLEVIEPQG